MKSKIILLLLVCMLALPHMAGAQFIDEDIYDLNDVLKALFDDMLPLCRKLIDVGRAIAGFAALWYIAMRVWKHIARAEGIDFFPLLRPFAIGMAILLFPNVISLMNDVLSPLETGTREMAKDSQKAIYAHILKRENETMGSAAGTAGGAILGGSGPDVEKYEKPDGTTEEDGTSSGLANVFNMFSIKHIIAAFFGELLHILFSAATLCINTIRTFYLIVLAIIGPIVFGLSVFDGFQNSLTSWFARYVHVYMWLPVANIFGAICSKILENMVNLDADFMSTTVYLIFLVIAIVGYTTVPNVAGYIVQAGGKDTLLHKVNDYSKAAATAAAGKLI